MDKIVEVILESFSVILGEQAKEIAKKHKLINFTAILREKIQENYIKKYENEKYFMELDGFLEVNKFYDSIVRNIFVKNPDSSKVKLSNKFVDMFINEYQQFQSIEQQIRNVVLELADSIYTSILDSNVLDENVALNTIMREKMNEFAERQSVSDEHLVQIEKTLELLTFKIGKIEKKKDGKEAYMELHKILCNETNSFFEKELAYMRWISEHGDLKEGLIYIANNCEKNNELNRAKKYYEYILEEYAKEEYELYNNWGVIELRQEQKEAAIKRFKKVLQYDENNINALYNLAIAHYTYEESFKETLRFIEKAFKVNPFDADVVSFYAAVLLEKDISNCEYAFNILNEALKHDPGNFYLNINLGFVYLFQKKFSVGIKLLEELNQKYPDHIECVSLLGMMYAVIGVENAEKAILMFQKSYNITKDEGYLNNIILLKEGMFFDSVMYNHKIYELYSDEELRLYSESKQRT